MRSEICLESMVTVPGRGSADGRLLLEALYRRQTGEPLPPMARTVRGKPFFITGGWHFSISHTKSRVFCALAPFPVGLDAEALDRQVRPGLPEKILAPGELEDWKFGCCSRRTLLTYWVLKEAWLKYTGQGLCGYPRDLCFRLSVTGPRLEGHSAKFYLLEQENHILALCSGQRN